MDPILNHNYQLIEGHRVDILFAPLGPAAILLLALPALLFLLGRLGLGDLVGPVVAGTSPSYKAATDKDCFLYYLPSS